jgi:hypothetical protein
MGFTAVRAIYGHATVLDGFVSVPGNGAGETFKNGTGRFMNYPPAKDGWVFWTKQDKLCLQTSSQVINCAAGGAL